MDNGAVNRFSCSYYYVKIYGHPLVYDQIVGLSKIGSPLKMMGPWLKQKALNSDLRQVFPLCGQTVFDLWCKKYGKEYDSDEEKERRFLIFCDNYKGKTRLDSLADLKYSEKHIFLRGVPYSEYMKRKGAGFSTKTNQDLLNSGIIGCNSVDEWEENFQKSIDSKKPVVVFFTSTTFKPWDVYPPAIAKIVKKNKHIIFLEVDMEELWTVKKAFKINRVPTYVFVKQGEEVDRCSGLDMDYLRAMIYKHDDLGF